MSHIEIPGGQLSLKSIQFFRSSYFNFRAIFFQTETILHVECPMSGIIYIYIYIYNRIFSEHLLG
jgi:hypothetical protein